MYLHSSCDKIHFVLSLMMLRELYYCYTKTTNAIMYNNAVLKIVTIIIPTICILIIKALFRLYLLQVKGVATLLHFAVK